MYADKNTKYYRHANRVNEWIEETRTLDIGAGDGCITALLGIKGVDDEPKAVELARERKADVVFGTAYDLPFKDSEFESAFMGDVLEHIEFPHKALQEMRRVITKYFYIASPLPEGKDKFHYKEWDQTELKELVEKEGFILVSMFTVEQDKRIYGKFKKN